MEKRIFLYFVCVVFLTDSTLNWEKMRQEWSGPLACDGHITYALKNTQLDYCLDPVRADVLKNHLQACLTRAVNASSSSTKIQRFSDTILRLKSIRTSLIGHDVANNHMQSFSNVSCSKSTELTFNENRRMVADEWHKALFEITERSTRINKSKADKTDGWIFALRKYTEDSTIPVTKTLKNESTALISPGIDDKFDDTLQKTTACYVQIFLDLISIFRLNSSAEIRYLITHLRKLINILGK